MRPVISKPWQLLLWAILLLAASLQLFTRSNWQTDLSAFLPQADNIKQEVLQAELRQGPATRLWMIALSSDTPGQELSLANASKALAEDLLAGKGFRTVRNNSQFIDSQSRELLFRYRYLLSNSTVDFSVAGLRQSLEDRLDDLSLPTAAFTEELIAADPVNSFLNTLNQLESESVGLQINQLEGVWFSPGNKSALLVAESVANGMDATGQQVAWQDLQNSIANVRAQFPWLQAEFAGMPLIALKTSKQTRAASIRLSALAGLLLAVLVLCAYRSWQALLMTALPVIIGVLFVAAISSLIYPVLHVLTMAFGVTLLGLALDYPVHLLSHKQAGQSLEDSGIKIWPTLRLGVVTTVLAFSALIWTDFEGIARLGVFSITGLIAAAIASRYLLPLISTTLLPVKSMQVTGRNMLENITWPKFPAVPLTILCAVVILIAASFLTRSIVWSDDLTALSPVPDKLITQEQQMRERLQLADAGSQVLVYADDLDTVLDKQQLLLPILKQAQQDGLLQGWQMAASLLPSQNRQLAVQKHLPTAAVLAENMSQAIASTPFVSSGFDQFQADMAQSKLLPALTADMLSKGALGNWVNSLLFEIQSNKNSGYAGIVRLQGLENIDELQSRLDNLNLETTWLVQPRTEISKSLAMFRVKLSKLLVFSAGITILVLMLMLRQPARVLGISMAVGGAIIGAAWFALQLSGSLNILHLIGLILVAGFGLDYALFFTRQFESKKERAATFHALLLCLCSSTIVFMLLAISGIRVLESIGVVVVAGVTLAFIFSWLAAIIMQQDEFSLLKEQSL